MGRPLCQWDNKTFANHDDVSYGTAPLENWDPTYLHLAPAVHMPSVAAIDASTFPAGYTLSPDAAYGGGMSSSPTQDPNHAARWPPPETASTPLVTAIEPVASMKAEPESCSGGQGISATPGRGGGGPGGINTGEEERPNEIAYNNAYVEGRWGLFRHARVMILITRKDSLAGVDLPSSLVYPKCKA